MPGYKAHPVKQKRTGGVIRTHGTGRNLAALRAPQQDTHRGAHRRRNTQPANYPGTGTGSHSKADRLSQAQA